MYAFFLVVVNVFSKFCSNFFLRVRDKPIVFSHHQKKFVLIFFQLSFSGCKTSITGKVNEIRDNTTKHSTNGKTDIEKGGLLIFYRSFEGQKLLMLFTKKMLNI